ncbi:hypothetical protein EZV62_022238 [Acer yangbiense]|uniref:Peptidyl-prolyl cis-trans isomerase n=1 Tax=Acer yangbiense TaxID=1000413 RepID=A0A5C7H8L8_9ROSI|nr:hypothetical protein EZV62_022238 [Acer yangbiense]
MFFHIVLERNMQLHPRHFGRNLCEHLVSKLIKDVEGTCSGRHRFVVAIMGVNSIGKGLIQDGTGFVTFLVKYQCVVFRPFKGEILESIITMVNKVCTIAMASAGENLNASQFYMTLRDDIDYLDGKHIVFVEVAEGFETLTRINEAYVNEKNRPYKNI